MPKVKREVTSPEIQPRRSKRAKATVKYEDENTDDKEDKDFKVELQSQGEEDEKDEEEDDPDIDLEPSPLKPRKINGQRAKQYSKGKKLKMIFCTFLYRGSPLSPNFPILPKKPTQCYDF